MKDFSIKEEVKVMLAEKMDITGAPISVDEVMEDIQTSELFLDMISFCISKSITEILKEKEYVNKDIQAVHNDHNEYLIQSLVANKII